MGIFAQLFLNAPAEVPTEDMIGTPVLLVSKGSLSSKASGVLGTDTVNLSLSHSSARTPSTSSTRTSFLHSSARTPSSTLPVSGTWTRAVVVDRHDNVVLESSTGLSSFFGKPVRVEVVEDGINNGAGLAKMKTAFNLAVEHAGHEALHANEHAMEQVDKLDPASAFQVRFFFAQRVLSFGFLSGLI